MDGNFASETKKVEEKMDQRVPADADHPPKVDRGDEKPESEGVVLAMEPNFPRRRWLFGWILETYAGKDTPEWQKCSAFKELS